LQRGVGQRVAGGLDAGQAGDLRVPFERRSQCVEHGQGGVDDLGADAVAGDEGGGNSLGHGENVRKQEA
jgi:hypothetical protein